MCPLNEYKWTIGGKSGEMRAEDVRSAIRQVVSQYVEADTPDVTEAFTSLRVQVQDKNYKQPFTVVESMPEFLIFNHQNKGNALILALWNRGYRRAGISSQVHKVDFILTDHAMKIDTNARVGNLTDYALAGVDRFFVYPHTARPNVINDIVGEYEGITAHFVSAPGHVDVMRAYGYDKPLHVIGWSLCPIGKFRACESPQNILFAPIHGRCAKVDHEANQKTFERLVELAKAGFIHLTVRYYRTLELSGLYEIDHPGITYHGIEDLALDWEQIDQADVVVGHQTFAWLAVARGIPTVMFGEDIPPHLVPMGKGELYPRNWEKYRRLMAYPYDLLTCDPGKTLELLYRAAASDRDIVDWKRRMIGEPFNPDAFVDIIEGYL